MRAGSACAAAFLLVLSASPAVADVEDYLGHPIVSVRLSVEGRIEADPPIAALIETRIGDALSMMTVRETIAHLMAVGAFERVAASASLVAGGVALEYELTPVHPVGDLVLVGANGLSGIDPNQLRGAISERFGPSPPADSAAGVARFIEFQLQQSGYLRAGVTSRVEIDHRTERAVLVFNLEPGQRCRIGQVSVVGDPGVSPDDLLGMLRLKSGAPYEPDMLARRIDVYLQDRRDQRHYEATLTLTTRLTEDDRVADINVTAAQGPRVRVVFAGDPLPVQQQQELAPIAREASAGEDLLEDSTNRIEDYLRLQGFRDATAPYQRQEVNGELLITFTVSHGPQYRVADVAITGAAAVPIEELAGAMRIRPGLPLSAADLDDDVRLVEEVYRRRGFAAVDVQPTVEPVGDVTPGASAIDVSVGLNVTEYAQTMVRSVQVEGNMLVPAGQLIEVLGLRSGSPFYAVQMALDRDALERRYADLGFQNAIVESRPGLSADLAYADVVYAVREGRQILVDHLLIVGNDRTSSETIAREVQLAPGEPLGFADVAETQRRLASLGLFRRTRINELTHGDYTTRDVVIAVEEAPVTTVGYGGGVEVGQRIRGNPETGGSADAQVEVSPRAFFEVSRRNLFGKNRTVTLFTSISLRPNDPSSSTDEGIPTGDGSPFGFSPYRILGTFREPRVVGTSADAYLTATIEQQIRSSFNFARRGFGAEVAGIRGGLRLSGSYEIQRSELFDEQIDPEDRRLVDRVFPQVRLSSFAGTAIRDRRNDELTPSSGHYVSVSAKVAARAIGSEVGFATSYMTAQLFRVLPRTNRIVFAGSARVGLATGFPRPAPAFDLLGNPVLDEDGAPVEVVVEDLPASERFFAGGDTTVRGFALDQLGTPETIDSNGFPLGGNGLLILNAELRVPVFGGFGVVGFVDSGNVFPAAGDIDLGQLRSAVGFGFRYDSPIGPIRVDMGIKTDRRDVVPGQPEKLTAWHVSLGQAF
jgi:outer membrane protein assembly complex protein YaeT